MLMTPERLAANQANSQRSTGPKTEAGKLVSRGNAIKHGLTGEGLALPDEDAAEVEAAHEQHFAEMKPKTRAGAVLVYKVALCAMRITRFAQAQAAILSQRFLDAGDAFDDAQFAQRDAARAKLISDPSAQLAVLWRTQVGVEWVIDAWIALTEALFGDSPKTWGQKQFSLFEALLGRSDEFPSYDDSTLWSRAARGEDAMIAKGSDFPGDSPAARFRWARDQMIAIAEAETVKWQEQLEVVTASTALARLNAIKASRYDDSKAGLLAQKYEAATNREMNKALKDFKVVEAEFAEVEPIAETAVPEEHCVEVGSFLHEPEAIPTPAESIVLRPENIPAQPAQPIQSLDPNGPRSLPTPLMQDENGQIVRY